MNFQRISSKQLTGSCRIAEVPGDKQKDFEKQVGLEEWSGDRSHFVRCT